MNRLSHRMYSCVLCLTIQQQPTQLCNVWWTAIYPNSNGKQTLTHTKVSGVLFELSWWAFLSLAKSLLTEFGIHYRLESSEQWKSTVLLISKETPPFFPLLNHTHYFVNSVKNLCPYNRNVKPLCKLLNTIIYGWKYFWKMMVFETYWQTQIFLLYFQIQNQECQITNIDSDKGKINSEHSQPILHKGSNTWANNFKASLLQHSFGGVETRSN